MEVGKRSGKQKLILPQKPWTLKNEEGGNRGFEPKIVLGGDRDEGGLLLSSSIYLGGTGREG